MVDPAVATINHDFVKIPVECRVILNKYILGKIIYLIFTVKNNLIKHLLFIRIEHD